MKECCSPSKENQKKDLHNSEESCCTLPETDYKKKTTKKEENGCSC